MTTPRFGRVQLMIMQVLWRKGRANAREITDALNRREPIAHSTVQTLLRKLEAKRAIDHEVEGRTFVFYPLVKEDKVKRGAARDLVKRVFGGSPAGLAAYLIEHERVTPEELEELRKLIERKREA
ncbi:MAG TPA: BlaI/MecI/CopY family transcriptional regulator [Thermoguttaceae bacterium]|nr:BlaI/MecI/CopY family transcriptional regulator [Thermoguttaceae bacterium]